MKELFDGVKAFSTTEFEKNRKLYRSIKRRQNPHTLFISCSDSRIVPTLITKSAPGDLFIIRNIANLVPYYRQSAEYLSTTSAIEYAVVVLEVQNIVVCGHSDCGGCRALYADETLLSKIPHTRKWLELAAPVREKLEQQGHTLHEDTAWLVEQQNIVLQLQHLLSYPYIRRSHEEGSLKIMGWYYDIGSGEIFNFNTEERVFERIE